MSTTCNIVVRHWEADDSYRVISISTVKDIPMPANNVKIIIGYTLLKPIQLEELKAAGCTITVEHDKVDDTPLKVSAKWLKEHPSENTTLPIA